MCTGDAAGRNPPRNIEAIGPEVTWSERIIDARENSPTLAAVTKVDETDDERLGNASEAYSADRMKGFKGVT